MGPGISSYKAKSGLCLLRGRVSHPGLPSCDSSVPCFVRSGVDLPHTLCGGFLQHSSDISPV